MKRYDESEVAIGIIVFLVLAFGAYVLMFR
jgi:hypothetical protein